MRAAMQAAQKVSAHYHCCGARGKIAMQRRTNVTDSTTDLEAAAFRRLLAHLNEKRTDVQNIDLMILAGFCRNCLADWYREAAAEHGINLSKDEAREHIYGEPFAQWKTKHQKEATPEQIAAFEAAQRADG
jgi:uncharacterized protein